MSQEIKLACEIIAGVFISAISIFYCLFLLWDMENKENKYRKNKPQ